MEEGREGLRVAVVLLEYCAAVMKEESTPLIWVPKEMPLNGVIGEGERCIEALTLFTCVMRFRKHWGRNGVSAPEGTSAEGTGAPRFARQYTRGRGLSFGLGLGLGKTADEGLRGGRKR